jgi:hypothetical protein
VISHIAKLKNIKRNVKIRLKIVNKVLNNFNKVFFIRVVYKKSVIKSKAVLKIHYQEVTLERNIRI